MMAGIKNVSNADWCLTSSTAPCVLSLGRCSMPSTRVRMPTIQRAESTHSASQARATR